jgi:predicted Zn-dependent protease
MGRLMEKARPLVLILISVMRLATGESWAHDSTEVAIARITSELSKQPEEARLYVDRASLHLEHRDWKACLADLDRADHGAKSDLALNRMRGRAFAMGGKSKDAVRALDAHLKSHPSDAAAWMEMAHVHESLGEITTAADDFQNAIRLMPHPEPDAIIECSDLLRKAGRDDEALALLNRAPLLTVIVDRAIAIDLAHARHDSALRRIDPLIAVTKVQEPLLAKRASILAQAGRQADAISAWKSLSERLENLPPETRQSRAMLTLASQCRLALDSLNQTSKAP